MAPIAFLTRSHGIKGLLLLLMFLLLLLLLLMFLLLLLLLLLLPVAFQLCLPLHPLLLLLLLSTLHLQPAVHLLEQRLCAAVQGAAGLAPGLDGTRFVTRFVTRTVTMNGTRTVIRTVTSDTAAFQGCHRSPRQHCQEALVVCVHYIQCSGISSLVPNLGESTLDEMV